MSKAGGMVGGASCVPMRVVVGGASDSSDTEPGWEERSSASSSSLSSSSSSSSSLSSSLSAAESIKLCLAGADLRREVAVLVLVVLVAGRGGLNAGRPRLARGLEVGGMVKEWDTLKSNVELRSRVADDGEQAVCLQTQNLREGDGFLFHRTFLEHIHNS